MLIETYTYDGEGYDPYLIQDNWQVAKLNYMPGQGLSDITKIDKHVQTDEVFILVKGLAVLIAAGQNEKGYTFHSQKMQPGITYNIKADTWHNIAMDADAEVIIVEKNNTHINDCIYVPLKKNEKIDLYDNIQATLNLR
jgi:hypothetical protein